MIKNLLVIVLLFAASLTQAQQVNWMTMNEALAAQKKMPKKIFMDVYTNWCGPCKLMDKKTFHNKDVVAYINEHFYAVKFNGEGTEEVFYNEYTYTNPNHVPGKKGRNSQHFLAHALKIQAYPSIVFFDESGGVIAPVAGYRTPRQLELYLKMIANDHYKTLKTAAAWKTYEKGFQAQFQE